jgi:cytosine/creatinine deaminase
MHMVHRQQQRLASSCPRTPAAACRMFSLAAERGLDLDFHVDENRNVAAKGLRYVAQKALQHRFAGRIVCGHCW